MSSRSASNQASTGSTPPWCARQLVEQVADGEHRHLAVECRDALARLSLERTQAPEDVRQALLDLVAGAPVGLPLLRGEALELVRGMGCPSRIGTVRMPAGVNSSPRPEGRGLGPERREGCWRRSFDLGGDHARPAAGTRRSRTPGRFATRVGHEPGHVPRERRRTAGRERDGDGAARVRHVEEVDPVTRTAARARRGPGTGAGRRPPTCAGRAQHEQVVPGILDVEREGDRADRPGLPDGPVQRRHFGGGVKWNDEGSQRRRSRASPGPAGRHGGSPDPSALSSRMPSGPLSAAA